MMTLTSANLFLTSGLRAKGHRIFRHKESINIRSSTEYEIVALYDPMVLPLIRHAGEGRHPGE